MTNVGVKFILLHVLSVHRISSLFGAIEWVDPFRTSVLSHLTGEHVCILGVAIEVIVVIDYEHPVTHDP